VGNRVVGFAIRTGRRVLRAALVRSVRAAPRPRDAAGAERRVYFLLYTAWGMGGTIRAVLNLAGHLARDYDVTIISVCRTSDRPFFPFPPGVKVVSIDDRRPKEPSRLGRQLRRVRFSARSSVLMDRSDNVALQFNLWAEIKLVRRLRRRTGFLVTTRPGLNILAAELAPPGLITIGQDHMNFTAYSEALRASMLRAYPRLDAVVLLTERDRASYPQLDGGSVRVEQIPNAVRDMGPQMADLDAKLVISAGRLTRQKGYDLLIPAFGQVVERHPEWRLRIFGAGWRRPALRKMIKKRGLDDVVTLDPPAKDLGAEMEVASVYALSSRFEGLPLVLLEAMSKGMAVLGTDCPTGPAELIEHRRNGILVQMGDVDALARGLLELIEDADLRRSCAAAAIETAREYAPAAVGARWETLLAELWAARAGRLG
jgi:glycosyltransferase involved in cell wall biosynthesis